MQCSINRRLVRNAQCSESSWLSVVHRHSRRRSSSSCRLLRVVAAVTDGRWSLTPASPRRASRPSAAPLERELRRLVVADRMLVPYRQFRQSQLID